MATKPETPDEAGTKQSKAKVLPRDESNKGIGLTHLIMDLLRNVGNGMLIFI
jgi:hypothetical protein